MTALVFTEGCLYSDDAGIVNGIDVTVQKMCQTETLALAICGFIYSARQQKALLKLVENKLFLMGELNAGDVVNFTPEEIGDHAALSSLDDAVFITKNYVLIGTAGADESPTLTAVPPSVSIMRGDTGPNLFAALKLTNHDLPAAECLARKSAYFKLGNVYKISMGELTCPHS